MKLREIKMGQHFSGYGEGAVPGIKCEVELQVGERYSSSVTITLTPEQTAEIVAKAVELAMTHLAFDPASIDVVGKPGTPRTTADFSTRDMPADEMVPL